MHPKWTLVRLLLPAALAWGCGGGGAKGGDSNTPVWTRQAMINACVAMHSCGVFRVKNVADCIQNYEEGDGIPEGQGPLFQSLHLCVAAAKGKCDAVRACFGAGTWDMAKDGKECDTSYKGGCDGAVRRFCDTLDGRIYRIDCAKGGLKCSLDQSGYPFCSMGPCQTTAKNDNTCSPDKTQHYTCNGEGLKVEQCDWISLTCGKDRDGKLDCVGTGKECSG